MITDPMDKAQRLQFDADLRGPSDRPPPGRSPETVERERDRANARAMQALGGHGLIKPPAKRPPRGPRATNR